MFESIREISSQYLELDLDLLSLGMPKLANNLGYTKWLESSKITDTQIFIVLTNIIIEIGRAHV